MPSRSHEHDHVLPDGTTVFIRPLRKDDDGRLLAMWDRTSEQSRRQRFHGHFDLNDQTVKRFTEFDPEQEFALAAVLGRADDEVIVGVARYVRDPEQLDHAEFAALIEDGQQGRGIGTALVREVALAAYDEGIRTLSGDVLADNARMMNLIEDLGFRHVDRRDASVVRADLGLDIGEDFLHVVDEDERRAAAAALTRFFSPESVAVVGASRNPTSIGGLVFDHILHGRFAGVVYPVNPNANYVSAVQAYPTLSALPVVPDLVVVCVPAPMVADVVDEAGMLGVRAVCVISAGFAEAGPEGIARHHDLVAITRGHGMRMIGPNCMGIMNASGDVRLNATFSGTFPQEGRLAFSSQSGALGLAVIEHANDLGLGLSTFVSVGNKADISGNDLLLYWEEDPDTDVVLLYLESFGNPRKFSRIARRISRRKPIVAVKSGRTSAGERAASSHTAAISAGDVAVQALFDQTGVIRTDTLEELFDVATLLSSQPLPRGNRIGIVTNAGGPGILAADACESNGLSVPKLSDDVQAQLLEFLPPEAGISNPIDMIASASASGFEQAVTTLANSGEVDAVFVIFIPAGITRTDDVARAMARARACTDQQVPIVSVFMSVRGIPEELADARIPSYSFPEDAARAMGRVARYATWRDRPLGHVVRPDDIDPDGARAIVEAALAAAAGDSDGAEGADGDGAGGAGRADGPAVGTSAWLTQADAEAVLDAYRVPRARSRIVTSAEDAANAQREWGVPVALKVAAPIHKTDVGGIELNLDSPEATADAFRALDDRLAQAGMPEHAGTHLVQEMITAGVEMVVGVSHDPSFGPLIATGLGGTLVELLRDVNVRITPLTDRDIQEMLDGLKMRPLLDGYRGSEPADIDALVDLLHRINAMVDDLPEVAELDLNPVFVRPRGQGVAAVDVRMKVAVPGPTPR
jgi:acetate---CoA ligase (ADP-forming)